MAGKPGKSGNECNGRRQNPEEDRNGWMQENPHRHDPRALQVSGIITKVLRHHCEDRRDEKGFVEAEQLLSRKFARYMKPEMNFEELMDLVAPSERYQVKVAQGEVKVRKMAAEDGGKREKMSLGKKRRRVKSKRRKRKDQRGCREDPMN